MPVQEVFSQRWSLKEMSPLFKVSHFHAKESSLILKSIKLQRFRRKAKMVPEVLLSQHLLVWHNQSLTSSSSVTGRSPSLLTSSWQSWTLGGQQKNFAAPPVCVILRQNTFEYGSLSTANPQQYPPRSPHHAAACATKPAVWDELRSHL